MITAPNMSNPDESYATLIAAHEGLSEEESSALNCRLILLLMNQIGDAKVIQKAIEAAKA